jgi:outer membrane protein OmpA-like peptidoglycan-associated protein
MRNGGPSRLPGPGHLGWWAFAALLLAIALHVFAWFALGHIRVALGFDRAETLRTRPIQLDQVSVLPPVMDDLPARPEETQIEQPTRLLDDIDLLTRLPEDHEMDLSPAVTEPEIAIQPGQAAPEGEPAATELDHAAASFDLDSELSALGRTADPLPRAAEGQVIVDPGTLEASNPGLDAFTEEILKQGLKDGAEIGQLDDVVTLDDMIGLPEDLLVGKRTLLPSDLLFEYNSAELRESARIGLMKLALVLERNPGLFCWIEGHTDLFGGDRYNLDLSMRRAAAVKTYLTGSLGLPGDKVVTRGFGETRPLVATGDVDRQAPNRRVEIKMRRTRPPRRAVEPEGPSDPPRTDPPSPAPAPTPAPSPEAAPEPGPSPPRARPVPEVPRAVPVPEAPPRARPIVPRALPVE